MDSTSCSINGSSYNLWTFLTKSKAIFHISKGNEHEVPLDVMGDHNGTDIHDGYSAFKTLAKETGNNQQYYWSRIISDAKELKEFHGYEGARIKRSLQAVFWEAKAFTSHGTTDDVERLYHKHVFLLDSDYEHRRSRRFVDNLLKRKRE